jgi:hypothetical protein
MNRTTGIAVITRGMSPAVCTAHVVDVAHRRRTPYKLIVGRPAVDAKLEAVEWSLKNEQDLLLVEDDITADYSIWAKALEPHDEIGIGTALMRSGELNTWFSGERVAYSGTVFLKIPYDILAALPRPCFQCRRMFFCDSTRNFIDAGERDDGCGSDTFFWSLVWEAQHAVRVFGSVTHHIHEFNNTEPRLSEPSVIKPLGIVSAQIQKEETVNV